MLGKFGKQEFIPETSTIMSHKSLSNILKQKSFHFWLSVSGFLGISMLPCPDCGSPMIVHLWPLALLFTLRHVTHRHREKSLSEFGNLPEMSGGQNCPANSVNQRDN
jgi:hypothetical protein